MKKTSIDNEKDTLRMMISIYCKGNKHGAALCGDCMKLLEYASERLDACHYGSSKQFCSSCAVHCYKPGMRERIRAVMRYAGPRMIWHHPAMALKYIMQKWEFKWKAMFL